jgi:hypothetical protein
MSDPRAFLDRLRAATAPVAHEPIARVEVPGMSLLVIEASERYEGCPGCAEKDALIADLKEAPYLLQIKHQGAEEWGELMRGDFDHLQNKCADFSRAHPENDYRIIERLTGQPRELSQMWRDYIAEVRTTP